MARLTEGTQNLVLSGISNPVTDSDAANKRYVDQIDSELRRIIDEDTDIHIGRGLEKTADSELQSIGGKIRTYNRTSNMLSETGVTWTRGDLVNITDQDSWLFVSGVNQDPYPLTNQTANQILLSGLTQAQATLIQNSGYVAIDATGLYRRRITGVAIPYTTGKTPQGGPRSNGQIVFNIDGVAVFASNVVWYLSAAGGQEGGVYVFNQDSDMRGATTISNWTKLLNNEIDIDRLDSEFQEVQRAIGLIDSELAHAARYTHGYGISFGTPGADGTPIQVDTDTIASRAYVDSRAEHDTTYTAGYGLHLSADSEFSVDTDTIASRAYVDSRAEHDTTYTAGLGLNLSSDSEFSVDTDTIATRAFVLAQHDSDTTYMRFDTDSDGLVRAIGHQAATGRPYNRYFLNAENEWVIPVPQVDTQNNDTDSDSIILRIGHDLNSTFNTPIYIDATSTIVWDTDDDTVSQRTGGTRMNAHVDTENVATRQWVRDNTHGGSGHYGVFTEDSDGLVPHPGRRADNESRFMNGEGNWVDVSEHIDIHDTETLIRALHDVEDSRWLPDTHAIETYGTLTKQVSPAVPGSQGSFAEMDVTVTPDPGPNPQNSAPLDINTHINIRYRDSAGNLRDTDVTLNTASRQPPQIPNPPQGSTDVAIWVANSIGNIYGGEDGQGAFYVIDRGTGDGTFTIRMDHEGPIDSEGSMGLIGEWAQNPSAYRIAVTNVRSRGSFHTNPQPAVDTDTDIIIWDQPIPQFGTTEQGNATYQPGLVPQPDILQRNDNHFLSGLGTWIHQSSIAPSGSDSSWRGRWSADTEYRRNDVTWNPNDNVLYYWDSDATPASDVVPHVPGNVRQSQPQITRLTWFANTNGTVRISIYDTDGNFVDTDILLAGVGNNNTFARLIAEGINSSHLSRIVTATNFGSSIDITWDSDRMVPTGSSQAYPPTGVARNGVILRNPTDNPAMETILNDTLNREIQNGFVRFTGRNHWNVIGDQVESVEYDRDSDRLTIFSSTGAQSVVISDNNPSDQAEIEALQRELNAGIGAIPVEDTGNLKGPRDYTRWTVADSELTFYVNGDDTDAWSAFDDQFNDLLYPNDGPAAVHFQMTYIDSEGDTVFSMINLVWESADDGTNEVFRFDSDSDKIVFALTNGTGHPTGQRIVVTDGAGNVTGNAEGRSGGAGFFRHVYAYRSDNVESPDIASQFNAIGIQHYDYAAVYPTGIPVVVSNNATQTPHISIMQSQGLWIDTESDRIIADQSIDTENFHQVVRMIDVFGISGDATNPIQYDASGNPIVVPVTLYQNGAEVLHTKTITYLSNGLPNAVTYHLGNATGPVLAVKNIAYNTDNRVIYTQISGG